MFRRLFRSADTSAADAERDLLAAARLERARRRDERWTEMRRGLRHTSDESEADPTVAAAVNTAEVPGQEGGLVRRAQTLPERLAAQAYDLERLDRETWLDGGY